MKRATTAFALSLLLGAGLLFSACERAVDDSTVKEVEAMNLDTGEVKTFASEGEVPPGWGVCPDDGCSEVPPPGVPCQNLGLDVCEKDPACRVRTLGCSTPGNPGPEPAGDPDIDPGAPAKPADPAMPEPPPEPTCEKVCVAKASLTCEELDDQQSCSARTECQWAQGPCPMMPCASDGTGCDVACPSSCQTKGPVGCEQLGEKQCAARPDCKWELGVCPAMACADPDDPNCVVECKPFCQPNDDVKPPTGECLDNSQCGKGQYCHFQQGLCGAVASGGGDTPAGSGSAGSGSAGSSSGDMKAPGAAPAEPPPGDPMPVPMPTMAGVCKDRNQPCAAAMMYQPVCGCDNVTYNSACEAAAAGVSILHQGECELSPPGGCMVNSDCGKGQYCKKEQCDPMSNDPMPTDPMPGSGGGSGGAAPPAPWTAGVCAERSLVCPEIYAPVCGCDGKTYSSDCNAAGAGANIAHVGECSKPTPVDACIVSGCSSQICAAEAMDSTCEWMPEYDCLKLTKCGLFADDGGCGWKQTPEYLACVKKSNATP